MAEREEEPDGANGGVATHFHLVVGDKVAELEVVVTGGVAGEDKYAFATFEGGEGLHFLGVEVLCLGHYWTFVSALAFEYEDVDEVVSHDGPFGRLLLGW